MADISATVVKKLRDKTHAGMMDCKKALVQAEGDFEKAVDILAKKGVKAGTAERATSEGAIANYVHTNGKVCSLVELRCETDFVARNDDFKAFAKDLCLHVAGTPFPPLAVRIEDLPADVVERERAVLLDLDDMKKKPEAVRDKIVEGRMRKFFEERVLLEQPFVKDDKITIKALLESKIKAMKENIQIGGFCRWVLGHEPILTRNGALIEG